MRRAKANVSQRQSPRHGSGDASSASDGSTLAITFIVALSKHPDVNVHISVTVGEMAGDTNKKKEGKKKGVVTIQVRQRIQQRPFTLKKFTRQRIR